MLTHMDIHFRQISMIEGFSMTIAVIRLLIRPHEFTPAMICV